MWPVHIHIFELYTHTHTYIYVYIYTHTYSHTQITHSDNLLGGRWRFVTNAALSCRKKNDSFWAVLVILANCRTLTYFVRDIEGSLELPFIGKEVFIYGDCQLIGGWKSHFGDEIFLIRMEATLVAKKRLVRRRHWRPSELRHIFSGIWRGCQANTS